MFAESLCALFVAVTVAFLRYSTVSSLSIVAAALLLLVLTMLVWRAQLRARRERDAASRSVRYAVEVAHVVAHTRCRRAALCARSNVGRPGGAHAAAEVTSFLKARHGTGTAL